MIVIRRVVGASMLPTLPPGQLVVAVRLPKVRVGDVVIVQHEGREKIKRVSELTPHKLFVLGDNPTESTDSRSFGWLPKERLPLVVVWPRKLARRTID